MRDKLSLKIPGQSADGRAAIDSFANDTATKHRRVRPKPPPIPIPRPALTPAAM